MRVGGVRGGLDVPEMAQKQPSPFPFLSEAHAANKESKLRRVRALGILKATYLLCCHTNTFLP